MSHEEEWIWIYVPEVIYQIEMTLHSCTPIPGWAKGSESDWILLLQPRTNKSHPQLEKGVQFFFLCCCNVDFLQCIIHISLHHVTHVLKIYVQGGGVDEDDLVKKKGKKPNGSKREECEEAGELFLEVRTIGKNESQDKDAHIEQLSKCHPYV